MGALSIICIPKFYITGDGASHTYNAKVLFDYGLGEEREFYKNYYTLNRHLDPNWSSHLFIGAAGRFVPYWMADKLFQIFYVLVFALGFRYFIRSIRKGNAFLSILFFPFLFTIPFQQGFYNYCLSLGFLFWAVGLFMRKEEHIKNPVSAAALSILLLATALSHGMPAIYAMFMISLLWLFKNWDLFRFRKIGNIVEGIASLLVMFLPSILLILMFVHKVRVMRNNTLLWPVVCSFYFF